MFWNRTKPNKIEENPTINEEISRIKARLVIIEANIMDILLSQQRINEKIIRKIRLKTQEKEDENPEAWAGIPYINE